MRKLFVALLILSVMGGAFAQEKGSWGTLSGEAALDTAIDFFGTNADTGRSNSGDPTIGGGVTKNGFKFGITYDNTFGDFALTLPLLVANGYFGTNGDDYNDGKGSWWEKTQAKLTYTNGDLTVKVPFMFKFATNTSAAATSYNLVGIVPMASGNAGIQAVYDNGTFGFKAAYHNLLTGPVVPGASGDNSLGGIGGYYHFMDGKSQLYVSYNGAYETKWWRASDHVLNPSLDFLVLSGNPIALDDTGTPGFANNDGKVAIADVATKDPWIYDPWARKNIAAGYSDNGYGGIISVGEYTQYHWENIKYGSDAGSGIAYRFFVMPELNVGISFTATPIFSGAKDQNSFVEKFLTQPVFGVKYDNETLAISAMLGLNTTQIPNAKNEKEYYINIPLAFGASYLLGDITIKGDISAQFYDSKFKNYKDNAFIPLFNAGAVVLYNSTVGEAPVIGGIGLKFIDLGSSMAKMHNEDETTFMFGANFMLAYNRPRDGNFGYEDPNAGFWANLKGHFNVMNYTKMDQSNMSDLNLEFGIGYKEYQLTEKMKLSVSGKLGVDVLNLKNVYSAIDYYSKNKISNTSTLGEIGVDGVDSGIPLFGAWIDPTWDNVDSISRISFELKPELVWSVFPNGSITFTYTLGSTDLDIKRAEYRDGKDDASVLNVNKFGVKFKWTL